MKKKAFTLAEVLVALGIVGVIAAVGLPAISQIMPDENKTIYLKAYDALVKKTNEIAYNSSIYSPLYEYDKENGKYYNVSYYPLYNMDKHVMDKVIKSSLESYAGVKKYAVLMCDALNGEDFTTSSSGNKFRTNSGVSWNISDSHISQSGTNITYYNEVIIDLNGSGTGPNKIYDGTSFKNKPDQFRFYVFANGQVEASDPYGQMYISNRVNLLRNKQEKELIKKFSTKSYDSFDDYNIPKSDIEVSN